MSWGTNGRVLVEGKQLGVRDDRELGRVQRAQLVIAVESALCIFDVEAARRHTSVPRRIGLLRNTQAAKCVRCS